jgi:hypothetical protein
LALASTAISLRADQVLGRELADGAGSDEHHGGVAQRSEAHARDSTPA